MSEAVDRMLKNGDEENRRLLQDLVRVIGYPETKAGIDKALEGLRKEHKRERSRVRALSGKAKDTWAKWEKLRGLKRLLGAMQRGQV